MRRVSRNVRASRFQYLQRIANELVGVELEQERLPVRPIAHRLLGGIETTVDGATAMPGLFATGECTWQGVHGANGLAGNTLTASVVLGQRAGAAAATHTKAMKPMPVSESLVKDQHARVEAIFARPTSEDTVAKISHELAVLMDEHVGIVRNSEGLAAAARELTALKTRYAQVGLRHHGKMYNAELTSFFELASLLDVAEVVITAAQTRKESRGVHYRTDFPLANDSAWQCHTLISQRVNSPQVETRPVNASLSS
jgi:succinate dehydrogenase/fumarate reductase flavoprotein subunit